jgi:hypothetical protein
MNNRFPILRTFLVVLLLAQGTSCTTTTKPQPPLAEAAGGFSPEVNSRRNSDGTWGLSVTGAGLASGSYSQPMQIEIWDSAKDGVQMLCSGYNSLTRSEGNWVGVGRLRMSEQVSFVFSDLWTFNNGTLRLVRSVRVHGNSDGGFLSATTMRINKRQAWPDVEWFAPGMIYGGFDHLSPDAIGGRSGYRAGDYKVRIREDRMPAPLIASRFIDHSTLAILNRAPNGTTTVADARSVTPGVLIDETFRFGAIGAEEGKDGLSVGYWFPGSEGSRTYRGDTYPGGQLDGWRWRFHPIRDQLEQRYEVAFRFGKARDFPGCYRDAWRWSWETLRPQINPQDITAARQALVDVLAKNVLWEGSRAGIPNFIDSVKKQPAPVPDRAVMGFTGKNLEAANFLLQEAALAESARNAELRRRGEAIISSFLALNLAPPVGEGFRVSTGAPILAIPAHKQVYLRSFGDDLKAVMKAWQREKQAGREHPEWLAWCRSFADWLLPQQQLSGGFPRSWKPASGDVVSASPNSSYNAVPLLVLLFEATGERRYLDGAIRAAEFCWNNGQSDGRFVGGTIDNPNVLDKEAATLSLEAYLELHRVTGETKWLNRARAAADFAETWIYLWNVPMSGEADAHQLGWKPGVPTTGLQLIATGHSLVDQYMAFDTDEFARLAKLTGDVHYRNVARLLLHNTKSMLALPGRTYDLGEPGWQQEHWSLAPRRGDGLHRGWLPWVSTSHLNGIFGLMKEDPQLLEEKPPATSR